MTLHRLDNRQASCALGLARVRQRMDQIAIGDLLEVTSRDRYAPFEIPAWAERAGHELVERRRSGRWWFVTHVVTIRKREAVTPYREAGRTERDLRHGPVDAKIAR